MLDIKPWPAKNSLYLPGHMQNEYAPLLDSPSNASLVANRYDGTGKLPECLVVSSSYLPKCCAFASSVESLFVNFVQ